MKKEDPAIANIKKIAAEIKTWPRWKLENTLLQFSEYQRKKAEYHKEKDAYLRRYLAPSDREGYDGL